MKKKKIIIAVSSVLLVLAVIATATFFAIFQSGQKTETSMTTGKINVELIEEFIDPDGNNDDGNDPSGDGLENATKVITGKNTGTQSAYVRVKIFPQPEYYSLNEEEWFIDGLIPTNYIKYNQDNNGWIDGGDGYLYYSKALPAGETTSTITITDLHLEIPDGMLANDKHPNHRVNMLVELEATQATNELYKINWGIDNLPSGVEIVQ